MAPSTSKTFDSKPIQKIASRSERHHATALMKSVSGDRNIDRPHVGAVAAQSTRDAMSAAHDHPRPFILRS